jgi:hypothetical protein
MDLEQPRGDCNRGRADTDEHVRPQLAYEFAGEEELGRAMVAPSGIAELVGPAEEDAVRRQIVEALAPCRKPEGSFRLENGFHFVIASA